MVCPDVGVNLDNMETNIGAHTRLKEKMRAAPKGGEERGGKYGVNGVYGVVEWDWLMEDASRIERGLL